MTSLMTQTKETVAFLEYRLSARWRRSSHGHVTHGQLQANCLRLLRRIRGRKLLNFDPAGLSHLRRHAGSSRSKTTDELKVALQTICEELPQEHINKAVANFTKRLTACVAAMVVQ